MEHYTANGRAVPWYDWNEWLSIKRQIFSNDVNEIKQAKARLTVWKKRNSRLPHAVDCTLSILQCMSSVVSSSVCVDMAIGMLIVRFVNGFLETSQKNSHTSDNKNNRYKQSISIVMDNLNIPKAIVDVRHAVTHGEIPSSSQLHHTLKLCFQWLKTHYWDKQEQQLKKDAATVLQNVQEYRRLLQIDAEVTPASKWNQIERKKNDCYIVVKQLMLNDLYSQSFHIYYFVMNDLLQEDLVLGNNNNAKLVERAQESIPLFVEMQHDCKLILVYVIRILLLSLIEMDHVLIISDKKRKIATMWLAIMLNDAYLTQIVSLESDSSAKQRHHLQLLLQHMMRIFSYPNFDSNHYVQSVKKVINGSKIFKNSAKSIESQPSAPWNDGEWELCNAESDEYLAMQMAGTCADTLHYSVALKLPEHLVRKRVQSKKRIKAK